jgi:TonB family protein
MEANSELLRGERRQRIYARNLRRAFWLSMGIHFLAALCVNPSLILRVFAPHVLIGYAGAPRRGDLAPQNEQGENRVALVRVRRFTGPVTLTNLSVVGTQADAPSANRQQPLKGNIQPAAPEERNARGGSGGSGGPLVFELGEDWTVLPGSGPVAQSSKFQVLKVVRPQYPYAAIRDGIEGLVKLEVRVDSTGKVAAVRAVENTASAGNLEQAAIQAMFLWEFKPYRVGSRPVPFTLFVPFRYHFAD